MTDVHDCWDIVLAPIQAVFPGLVQSGVQIF